MLMWWLLLAAFSAAYVILVRSIRNERLRVLWIGAGALVLGLATGFCASALVTSFLWGPPTDTPGIVGRMLVGAIVGVVGALLELGAVLAIWARARLRVNALCTALALVATLTCGAVSLFQ